MADFLSYSSSELKECHMYKTKKCKVNFTHFLINEVQQRNGISMKSLVSWEAPLHKIWRPLHFLNLSKLMTASKLQYLSAVQRL